MGVESDLYARLTGFAGLSALIGARVYPGSLPQGTTLPAIAYRRVSTTKTPLMGADAINIRSRFQFDVWATEYRDLRPVAEALKAALTRYRGASSVTIEDCYLLGEVEFTEPETLLEHAAIDFEVNYF